jgi:hypothetical protein
MDRDRYLWRVIASVVVFLLWVAIALVTSVPSKIVSAQIAGRQFDNSDTSYGTAVVGISVFNLATIIIGSIFLLILLAIWWKPLRKLIAAAIVLVLVCGPRAASAYYDRTDYTEAYFILPNESAFFIPDVGANKDSQSAFGSVEYLNSNKIAAQRFLVPHAKLAGSSL